MMRPSAISRALMNCTAPLFVPVRWLSAPYSSSSSVPSGFI